MGYFDDLVGEAQNAAPAPKAGYFDDLVAGTQKPVESAQPVSTARSALIGAHQGLLAGWADELAGLRGASGFPVGTPPIIAAPVGAIRRAIGSEGAEEAYKTTRDQFRAAEKAASEQHPIAYGGGQVAGTVAGAAVPLGATGRSAGLLGNVGRGALGGAALGAVQGAGEAPEMSDMAREAGIGSLMGGFVGAAVPVAVQAVRRAVSPLAISPERRAAANVLRQEGVDVTPGQESGNRAMRYFESEMGGNRAQQIADTQGEQFTQAALARAGENADRATPEVVDRAFRRIGGDFDALAARNTMTVDRQLGNDLLVTARDYFDHVGPSARAPVVENSVRDIATMAGQNGGVLPGDVYKAMRSRLNRDARASRNDPQLQDALFGIQNALDDAMERGMSPADQAAWRQARNQYRNMLVIEKAATGAGERTAEGIISPAQLRTATVGQNRRAYARGQGDFADLARSGVNIMSPMPDSGTASRLAARGLTQAVSGAIGGAAGSQAGEGYQGALLGALGGAAAPRVAARLALSQPGQAFLRNQMAAGTAGPSYLLSAPLLELLGGQRQSR